MPGRTAAVSWAGDLRQLWTRRSPRRSTRMQTRYSLLGKVLPSESTVNALRTPPSPPMALIAAEHTAQLNTAQADDVFSKAGKTELLFQDVDLGPDNTNRERPAIDVLSCTTTMEVGIDIGALSRSLAPQHAAGPLELPTAPGPCGPRGNAVATVTAFGSADSHDEHYFTHPDQMIRGAVDNQTLTLDNAEIARRHVTAYLLQRYHQAKLPRNHSGSPPAFLRSAGERVGFQGSEEGTEPQDLEQWLRSNETALKSEVAAWLPSQIVAADRQHLLRRADRRNATPIDDAIEYDVTAFASSRTREASQLRPRMKARGLAFRRLMRRARNDQAVIQRPSTSSTVCYTRACCLGTPSQPMSPRFTFSIWTVQHSIGPPFGSRRHRGFR